MKSVNSIIIAIENENPRSAWARGVRMYAFELLHDKNCVFDVSSSMMFMPEGEAEKYIRAYGAERMLFGTDFPLWNPVEETKRFLQLKLTDPEFEQIGSKTALRILGE